MDGSIVDAAREVMARRRLAGLLVAVARGGRVEAWVEGADAAGAPLPADALFPVASVTKLATALAVLRLVDRGALELDDPLGAHLPGAAASGPEITVRRLLAHTSGLPHDLAPGAAPYGHDLDWPRLRAACLATAPADPPDRRVVYSNLGYGLLAALVEHLTGADFPDALRDLVLAPLGVEASLGADPPRRPARLAISGQHDPALEPYNSPFWHRLGAPWSGLVTDAAGALALARAYATDFLAPATRREATSDQAPGLSGGLVGALEWSPSPWGLGPELRGLKGPRHWAPPTASPGSWGHAGMSGCVVWHEPAADLTWFLAGTRDAANGWLLEAGPKVGAAALAATPP